MSRRLEHRALKLVWHDTIVLEERLHVDPLRVHDRVYIPGDKLKVETTFSVIDPVMRLTDELGREILIDGYELAALRYTVIPAPEDEPF